LFHFKLEHTDSHSAARIGRIETGHGIIETPIFMPVGTVGSVKAAHIKELEAVIHAQIILGNTYHLYLRPGLEVMEQAGGLHGFNNWQKPILTDSGGYQVYSLSHQRKIKEEGVTFASHIDGSKHFFTPENVMDIQRVIGADIVMAFDECPPYPSDYNYAKNSMELTHRWLQRCVTHFNQTEPKYGHEQALFPIVQGSTYRDLRMASAETVAGYDLKGNAIGGVSVGEPTENMYEITDWVCQILPKEKPRYLMGVGTPMNILECIALGVDMFDCVLPTRNARHGLLYTANGIMNMKNAHWRADFSAIDEQSPAATSRAHTKAYLHHLFRCEEILALQIATLHNLSFFLWLVGEARRRIRQGDFLAWKNTMVENMQRKL
jgi:queuine tRNA-ribosyltransferase